MVFSACDDILIMSLLGLPRDCCSPDNPTKFLYAFLVSSVIVMHPDTSRSPFSRSLLYRLSYPGFPSGIVSIDVAGFCRATVLYFSETLSGPHVE